MTVSPQDDAPRWLIPWTLDEGSDRARALFEEAFGGEPEAIVSAPGRITVIGDHTDYTEGLSLAAPVAHRTFVAVRRREDEALRMVSGNPPPGEPERWEGAISALVPGTGIDWPYYASGVVWALTERGYSVTGLDLAIVGCLPLEAGLGASASLTAGVGLACNAVWGLALDGEAGAIELAEAAWDAESAYVGFPCGRLDTHTVLRCAEDEAVMVDFATVPPSLTRYPLYFHDYGLRLLVVDTGARRDDWMDAYARRSRDARLAAQALGVDSLRLLADEPDGVRRLAGIEDPTARRRARHIVTEDRRVADAVAALGGWAPHTTASPRSARSCSTPTARCALTTMRALPRSTSRSTRPSLLARWAPGSRGPGLAAARSPSCAPPRPSTSPIRSTRCSSRGVSPDPRSCWCRPPRQSA
ncbi:hypothetical protein GCM10025873_27420 [Demequina sediminis]|nr:galactokinase family protein [Demequina sediminis]BDZ62951.1 hypothetical protein GCM10025873_27420 [Demequina sediminis]